MQYLIDSTFPLKLSSSQYGHLGFLESLRHDHATAHKSMSLSHQRPNCYNMTSNNHKHVCITCAFHNRFAMPILLVTSFQFENTTAARSHSINNMLIPLLSLDKPSPVVKALIIGTEASSYGIQLSDILRGQAIHLPCLLQFSSLSRQFRDLSLPFLYGCAVNRLFDSSHSLIFTLSRSLPIQPAHHEL